MKRAICLFALTAFALTTGAGDVSARPAPAAEGPIEGTWVGYRDTFAGKVKYTAVLGKDGKYVVTADFAGFVGRETGAYEYKKGLLDTTPEGNLPVSYKVKWIDRDTIEVEGGGMKITYKRQ